MTNYCNNTRDCHNPVTLSEDEDALRVYCSQCHGIIVIRKQLGVVENRQYSKVFKRDILQGKDPLFYKIYPKWLKI